MPAHKLFPKARQPLGLTRRGRRRQRAAFQRLNRRQVRVIRAAKTMSRLFHLGFYAMEPSRAIGHRIAIFADLQFPVAVCGTNHELRLAYLLRHPLVTPETPRNFSAWLRDLRFLPGLAV